MLIDELQPFVISLLVGLGVGIERERDQANAEKSLGVRSFALLALSGTILARVHDPSLTLGIGLGVAAMLAISYQRSVSVGLTTELAAAVVFGLGYLATSQPTLVAVLGIIVAILLFSRQRLHLFSQHLSKEEMRAALILAVVAIIIVPFLPEKPIDPWGLFNPRRFAQVMMLIMAIEFGGYVVERVAGSKIGALATGFFGGLASSTALFVSLLKEVRTRPEIFSAALGSGLMATSATVCLYTVVVLGAAPGLVGPVAIPAGIVALSAALFGLGVARNMPNPSTSDSGKRRSPLDLKGVFKLSALVTGLFALTLAASRLIGPDAVDLLNFVGGLFELQSVAFATSNLFTTGTLDAMRAAQALQLALLASFVTKLILTWILCPGRFALAMSGLLVSVVAIGATAMFIAVQI